MRSPVPTALLGLTLGRPVPQSYGLTFDYSLKMTPQDWQRLIDAIAQLEQLPGSGADQILRDTELRAAPFIHALPVAGPGTVPKDEVLRRWRPTREPTEVGPDVADEPTVGASSVWPDSRLLVDYAPGHDTKTEYGGYVVLPRIDDATKQVYVLSHPTFGQAGRGNVELDSFSLADGTRRVVSTMVARGR